MAWSSSDLMAAVLDRMFATMRSAYCAYAEAAPGGGVMEMPGVSAYVMPRIPERSFFNGVIYEQAAALQAALFDVAAGYERAGVTAWTVWSHESDGRASQMLERAGHRLDASPAAMVLDLDSIVEPAAVEGLEIEEGASMEEALPVLESSYEVALRGRAGGWGRGTRSYLGSLEGRAASVLGIHAGVGWQQGSSGTLCWRRASAVATSAASRPRAWASRSTHGSATARTDA
jgi:hypothetical protein